MARLSEEELAKLVENSKGTTEQRRHAGKTLSGLASLKGNDGIDDAYRDKWQAIRGNGKMGRRGSTRSTTRAAEVCEEVLIAQSFLFLRV